MNWYEKRHDYWKNCKHLDDDQLKAVQDMIEITDVILHSISERYDLDLSDIRTLENARWAIYRSFPSEEPGK